MGVFLYYVPDLPRPQVSAKALRDAGLGDVLRDCVGSDVDAEKFLTLCQCYQGPDGKAGVVLAARPPTRELQQAEQPIGYYPQRQRWTLAGKHWVGIDTQARPTPEDLARETTVGGYFHTLGDGRDWLCPCIRRPFPTPAIGQPNLPTGWGLGDDGKFQKRVLAEYQWAWDLAQDCWAFVVRQKELDDEDAWRCCVRLLGLNYRLGDYEASLLELVTDRNFRDIIQAAVDGPLLEDFYRALQSAETAGTTTDESAAAGPPSSFAGAAACSGPRQKTTDPASPPCSSPPAARGKTTRSRSSRSR